MLQFHKLLHVEKVQSMGQNRSRGRTQGLFISRSEIVSWEIIIAGIRKAIVADIRELIIVGTLEFVIVGSSENIIVDIS